MGVPGSPRSRDAFISKSYKEDPPLCILEGDRRAHMVADFRMRFRISSIVLIESNLLGASGTLEFSCAAYRKMIQNLPWARCFNTTAILFVTGFLYELGILVISAITAMRKGLSAVIVALFQGEEIPGVVLLGKAVGGFNTCPNES
jgi:hypothetical protein